MWAFMPAIANWIGAMPFVWRFSNSGAQAFGIALPAAAPSTAAKYRSAKTMSRREMNSGSRVVRVAGLLEDGVRDREVELVEARDAVAGVQRRGDRIHPCHDAEDRVGGVVVSCVRAWWWHGKYGKRARRGRRS